jgi:putative hydrolase of the HAD superfamily
MFKKIWNKKRVIKLICFDLDNTLYDYGTAEAETEVHMAVMISEKNKRYDTRAIMKKFSEIKKSHMHHDLDPEMFSRKLWFSELLEDIGFKGDISLMSKRLEYKYWSFLVQKIILFPNTIKTLDLLKQKYKLACITDSDGERDIKINRIKNIGLDTYFDYTITTDDTGKNKPSIENWEYLLKLSGLKAEECMMVGDHPDVDLVNAKKLGFVTVWTKEHIHIDIHLRYVMHEINDIKELLDVLKKY